MKRVVLVSAAAGFVVTIVFGFFGFTVPSSSAELYWNAWHLLCPPMLIPYASPLGKWYLTPFENAALYAVVALAIYGVVRLMHKYG